MTSHLRIGFYTQSYPPDRVSDGVTTYVQTAARALADLGNEVHVVDIPLVEQGDSYTVDNGVHVHREEFRPTLWSRLQYKTSKRSARWIRASQQALRLLHELDLDVIEVPNSFVGATNRAPTVVHLHDSLERVYEFRGHSRVDDLTLALVRRSTCRAAAVVSPSDLMLRESRRHGWRFPHISKVIPLPLDVTPWTTSVPAGHTEAVVLYAGFLGKQKGVDLLVDAVAEVRNRIPTVRLQLVGHQYRDRGLDGIARGDGLTFVDALRCRAHDKGVELEILDQVPRDELCGLYEQARVVVQPSRFDAFALSVVEAMAASRPVVTSSHVGASWLAEASGGGAVATSEDPSSFAAAIEPYLRDPELASQAGRAGRRAVEEHCAPENNAVIRTRFFEEVVAAPDHELRVI